MLLILKYKYTEVFNRIFITNNCDISNEAILKNYSNGKNKYFNSNVFKTIMEREKIGRILFSVQNKRERVYEQQIDYNGKAIIYDIDYFDKVAITASDTINVSNCLFYDDIKKWDKIKNKPLVKYIQEKLEFFDFEWENN